MAEDENEIPSPEFEIAEYQHGGTLVLKSVSTVPYAPYVYGLFIMEPEMEYMGSIEALSWKLATSYGTIALRNTREGRLQALCDMLEAIRNIHYFYDNLTSKKIIYTSFGLKLKCEVDEKQKTIDTAPDY